MEYPPEIRLLVYSFFDFSTLLHEISGVSKSERKLLTESPLLDQKRVLRVNIQDGVRIKYNSYFLQAMALATEFDIYFYRFRDADIFLVSALLHLIARKYKYKPINLHILVGREIDSTCFDNLFQAGLTVNSLVYKLQTYNHHDRLFSLLPKIDIAPKVEIDCNGFVLSGLMSQQQRGNQPLSSKAKKLVCKVVGNNFDSMVRNFPEVEELTYISTDFIQIDQNLGPLKKLRKFSMECQSVDDPVTELTSDFRIIFADSSKVDLQLHIQNANLELVNILEKCQRLNVKSSEIRTNQLKIKLNCFVKQPDDLRDQRDHRSNFGGAGRSPRSSRSQRSIASSQVLLFGEERGPSSFGFDLIGEIELNDSDSRIYKLRYIKSNQQLRYPFELRYDLVDRFDCPPQEQARGWASPKSERGQVRVFAKELNISA